MSSATTSCVMHLPNSRFFVKSEDILDIICGGSQAKCAAHRVLEVRTNGRFTLWANDGHEGEPPEAFLWFLMDWDDFVWWSLNDRERTSFRTVIPQIAEDGYLLIRYVKVEDIDDGDGSRLRRVLCNAVGQPYTWKTYREAAADQRIKGIIMTQYRYLYQKVNKKLIEVGMPPDPAGGSDEAQKNSDTSGDESGGDAGRATQEGVTSTAQPDSSAGGGNLGHTAAPCEDCTSTPCQNQQGGTDGAVDESDTRGRAPLASSDNPPVETGKPPCQNWQAPPVEIDKILESSKEESGKDHERSPVAPSGAGGERHDDSCFTEAGADAPEPLWTVKGIYNQAAVYLAPLPPRIRQEQKKKNEEDWMRAVERIHRSLYFAQIPESDRPQTLERLLVYLTDPASPCAFRRYVEQKLKPRPFVPRLWHLANNLDCIAKDMDEHPEWQPPNARFQEPPPHDRTAPRNAVMVARSSDVIAQFLWIGKCLHYAAMVVWQDKTQECVEFGAHSWQDFAACHGIRRLEMCVDFLCRRHSLRLEDMPAAQTDSDVEPAMTPDVAPPLPGTDDDAPLSVAVYQRDQKPKPGEPGAPGLTYKAANELAERMTREQNWQCCRYFEQGALKLKVEYQPGQVAVIGGIEDYDTLLACLAQDPLWAEQKRRREERYAQFAAQFNQQRRAAA